MNALHPGLVATNLLKNNGVFGHLLKFLLGLMGVSAEEGAQTSVYLATSPEVEGVTGQYFINRKAVESSKASYDTTVASRLWEMSAELTGLPVGDAP